MFVLGHLIATHESGVFGELDLRGGEHGLALMLPDLLSCHDWGYSLAWSLAAAGTQADLVVAHMIGDAVVHFGQRWEGFERKRGWAYCRMGLVTRRYDEFFTCAEECGWRERGVDRDSRRGWAHTLVEYSIDQWLADRRDVGGLFKQVRSAAADTARDLSWVTDLVEQHVITPSKPMPAQPYRYCDALTRSEQPDEFHLRGLAVKFRLAETPECLSWLRSWVRHIWTTVGDDEMSDVLHSLCHAVADPVRFGYPVEISDVAGVADDALDRWRLGAESLTTGPPAEVSR